VSSAERPEKVAFKLKLKPGMAAEYKKRHDEIWPELSQAIREAGISDFTIYLDEETDTLFSVQKLAPGHTAAKLRDTELMRKWWAHMAPLMETHPDQSPVRTPLKEVFHLD
jgi:L-rhamnose mutarotase